MPTQAAYGSWKSPITSKLISLSSRSFQEIHVDLKFANADTVYWNELRYEENGRYVICSLKKNEDPSKIKEWTQEDFNARTTVHEYGGGAFFVFDGIVYFSNFSDQRLYRQTSPTTKPEPVTEASDGNLRYADGVMHPTNGHIYTVREDHNGAKTPSEVINTLVMFKADGTGSQTIITKGKDFYSSPRISPDGTKIAWVEWDFPNMPWDDTELYVATLNSSGNIEDASKTLVKQAVESASVMQPFWGPDNSLFYISDVTDWWNLYNYKNGTSVNILPRPQETGGPQWNFAEFAYAVDPNIKSEKVIATVAGALGVVDLSKTPHTFSAINTGYKLHDFINVLPTGEIYCTGASSNKVTSVIKITLESKEKTNVTVLRESKKLNISDDYISKPKNKKWKSGSGESYGYYYAPQNKDFEGLPNTLPPLLVKTHGGPTAATTKDLNLNIQYFTSRGFAVLDTNYRGSTGYGRAYRQSLYHKWGVYDVEDVSNGARKLVAHGLVNGKNLCIDGGSAGGYTTLASLTFGDTFQTGVSNYGISDLRLLLKHTHKFESQYPFNLVGKYDPDDKHSVYITRSPVENVDELHVPIALFQGGQDKIVPPEQSEKMYKAAYDKNLPCMFMLFPGEQHGFRLAQNIEKAIDGEMYFYSKIFGFNAADNYFPIDNMSEQMNVLPQESN